MKDVINKRSIILLIIVLFVIVLLIVTIVVALACFNMNKKEKEDYIQIFYRHEKLFTEISASLMSLNCEMNISKELDDIIVKQNGSIIEVSKCSLDEEIKNNIKRAIGDLGLRSIDKTKTYLEFVYDSNQDLHSIVYATDRNQLNCYTDIQHLEGCWYYCYVLHE